MLVKQNNNVPAVFLPPAFRKDEDEIRAISVQPGETFNGAPIASSEQKRRILIGTTIAQIARAFGAKGEIPSDVLSIVVDFVLAKYSEFTISEIKEAFFDAASEDSESVSFFGGGLSVEWASRSLTKHKRKVAERQKAKQDAAARFAVLMEDESEKKAKREESFRDSLRRVVRAFLHYLEGHKVEIPLSTYKFLERIGAISPDNLSKINAYRRACPLALAELSAAAENSDSNLERRRLLKQAENGGIERAAEIAANRIVRAWFWWWSRKAKKDFLLFEEYLAEKLEVALPSLVEIRYRLTVKSANGATKETNRLSQSDAIKLATSLDSGFEITKIELC